MDVVVRALRWGLPWLSVFMVSACLAAVLTYRLSDASVASEPLVSHSSGVPDGIPDGADAWSAGKIKLDVAP